MVAAYGQDDKSCVYSSLRAMLSIENPERTAVCLFSDKEEIGSMGNTGMQSHVFDTFIAELLNKLRVNRPNLLDEVFCNSRMLSADVDAAMDPLYAEVSDITNAGLVITIIVLLILTGVTIGTITGNNGIFGKALFARDKYKNAQEEETATLNGLESQIPTDDANLPENTAETNAGTQVKLLDGWYVTTAGYVSTTDGSIVKKSIRTANVTAVSDGNNNTIPVPNGFYYVGGTKTSGVVISDNKEDQNKYAGQEDVPAGVEYDTTTGIVNNYILKGNQFVWIPVDGEYEKINWGYGNNLLDASTQSSEYDLITKYGGFYVGRYEAGVGDIKLSSNINFSAQNSASSWQNSAFSLNSNTLISGKISEKAGEIPYYHADFKSAQTLSRNMYQTDSVKGGLITGTMWDSILKFIISSNNNNDSIVKANSSWGNFNNTDIMKDSDNATPKGRYAPNISAGGNSAFEVNKGTRPSGWIITTTGISEKVKKNNLYDIAGNLWEWTEEPVSSEKNIPRGAGFDNAYTGYPVCYRGGNSKNDTYIGLGFRPALYIM